MSSELERLLRQAGERLPGPQARITRRARAAALAAIRGRSHRLRFSLALATALLVACGLGIGIGTLIAPTGTAARSPTGLGFLPDRGWYVYQTGSEAAVGQPAYAIAANVPLDPDDLVDGRPSSLPYSTLLRLPRNGIVIVADFTLSREHHSPAPFAPTFRPRTLPLSLRNAEPDDQFATQIRPNRPLGQYQLRAAVQGHAVDLRFYFGSRRPSRALVATAQRQLDRLVVSPAEESSAEQRQLREAPPSAEAALAATRVFDRTFRCTLPIYRGIPKLEVRAASGFRENRRFRWLGHLTFTTFQEAIKAEDTFLNLAGLTAGWPPPTTIRSGGMSVSLERCTQTKARPSLTPGSLQGGLVGAYGDTYNCYPPSRIQLRIRAVFHSPTSVRIDSREERSLFTIARITKGSIVVQTLSGKRIAYGQIFESGRTLLFLSSECVPD